MPRDFVPCVYHEREVEHPLTGAPIACCDVIELHQFCVLQTQAEDVLMGSNSHQFSMRDTDIWVHPEERAVRMRAPLFAHFYAAMAALE